MWTGLDWGGVGREWFELICKALFSHEQGFFTRFKEDDPQALVNYLCYPSQVSYLSKGGVTLCNFRSNGVATQVAEELHGVPCYLCNLSRNIFVARNVVRSRTQFYFLQRLQQLSIAVAQCNTPPATCLAMLCSISQSGSLLSSRSQFCEFLAVPFHSVTPLFV